MLNNKPKTKMKRILVVDDEPNIRKALGLLLRSEGFEVDFAGDGEEALSKLKGPKPDLVLLDMFMPKLSGRATLEKIRANPKLADLKVIFLTVALFSEAGKKGLRGLGISDYVTKPFENNDLVARVRKALKT